MNDSRCLFSSNFFLNGSNLISNTFSQPKGEPYDPYAEAAKLRPKAPAAPLVTSKHSSSEEGAKPGRGARK